MAFRAFTKEDWYGYAGAAEDAMMWDNSKGWDITYEPSSSTIIAHEYIESERGGVIQHMRENVTLDEATALAEAIVKQGKAFDFRFWSNEQYG